MFIFQNKKLSTLIKILFIYLFFAIYHSFLLTSAVAQAQETIIPILTYHNFTTEESSSYRINIDKFTQQMDYLATNGFSVISISQLLENISNNTLPPKPVVITIDDGYKSTYTLAYPILKKYHFPANLFIYTDFIEKNSHSLTWEEIKEMEENNFEIGSHTISHCNLLKPATGETDESYLKRIKREIFLSKEILSKKIEKEVQFFAYPYGVYDSKIKQLAVQAGYQGIVNVNSMNNNTNPDPFALNRQIISGQNSLDSFKNILAQHPLPVSEIYPADGSVSTNQLTEVSAVFEESIDPNSIFTMKLGGAKVKFDYDPQNRKISFTPNPLKPLIKKSYIVNITTQNKQETHTGKTSWLITIK